MGYIKTTVPGLVRDEKTGVIINTNNDGANVYRAQIAAVKENKKLKETISEMESKYNELIELVKNIKRDV